MSERLQHLEQLVYRAILPDRALTLSIQPLQHRVGRSIGGRLLFVGLSTAATLAAPGLVEAATKDCSATVKMQVEYVDQNGKPIGPATGRRYIVEALGDVANFEVKADPKTGQGIGFNAKDGQPFVTFKGPSNNTTDDNRDAIRVDIQSRDSGTSDTRKVPCGATDHVQKTVKLAETSKITPVPGPTFKQEGTPAVRTPAPELTATKAPEKTATPPPSPTVLPTETAKPAATATSKPLPTATPNPVTPPPGGPNPIERFISAVQAEFAQHPLRDGVAVGVLTALAAWIASDRPRARLAAIRVNHPRQRFGNSVRWVFRRGGPGFWRVNVPAPIVPAAPTPAAPGGPATP